MLSVSSDFIVGFPGETDEDFNALMKLIDDVVLITASALSSARARARLLRI
jgi:tRNA A37 methylthiotransferase MiaB